MTRRLVSVLVIAALAQPAAAEPRTILVLKGEGGVEAATRAKIDASLIKLARTTSSQVQPGDITFSDAAAAVGCQPTERTCRDEVIDMLGVDEIVYASMSTSPAGLEVHVHRVAKGTTRDAKTTVAAGQAPEQLDDIAPLFGGAARGKPVEPVAASTKPRPEPAEADPTARPAQDPTPPASQPAPGAVQPAPIAVEPTPPIGATAPPDTAPSSRLPKVGMIGGGTMVLFGLLLWGQASDIRGEIDSAPTSTLADLQALAELERRGDRYAGWGNLMVFAGAIVGGIGTYYYVKDRRRRAATTARITPAVFDHGAGLVLQIGGNP